MFIEYREVRFGAPIYIYIHRDTPFYAILLAFLLLIVYLKGWVSLWGACLIF
jgi:hypothetical protein